MNGSSSGGGAVADKQISTLSMNKRNGKIWRLPNGQIHRINGPAVETPFGTKQWFVNGNRHRIDGPAIEWNDGIKEWWINNDTITHEVNEWLIENNITYPFNEDELIQFKLRFL